MTLSRANKKRLLLSLTAEQSIFRVYRQGHPKDVMQCFWLTTDPEIRECSGYDFDIRQIDYFPSFGTDDLEFPLNSPEMSAAIARAVESGDITFPPATPGQHQVGYTA
jgi:hypothetical protein